MPTVAAEIKQANKRRSLALERGGIDLVCEIRVLAAQNELHSARYRLLDNFGDMLWRWLTSGKLA